MKFRSDNCFEFNDTILISALNERGFEELEERMRTYQHGMKPKNNEGQ